MEIENYNKYYLREIDFRFLKLNISGRKLKIKF